MSAAECCRARCDFVGQGCGRRCCVAGCRRRTCHQVCSRGTWFVAIEGTRRPPGGGVSGGCVSQRAVADTLVRGRRVLLCRLLATFPGPARLRLHSSSQGRCGDDCRHSYGGEAPSFSSAGVTRDCVRRRCRFSAGSGRGSAKLFWTRAMTSFPRGREATRGRRGIPALVAGPSPVVRQQLWWHSRVDRQPGAVSIFGIGFPWPRSRRRRDLVWRVWASRRANSPRPKNPVVCNCARRTRLSVSRLPKSAKCLVRPGVPSQSPRSLLNCEVWGRKARPCLEGGRTRPSMGRSMGSAAGFWCFSARGLGLCVCAQAWLRSPWPRAHLDSRRPIPGLDLGRVPARAPGTRARAWEGSAVRPGSAEPVSKSLAFYPGLTTRGHPHGPLPSGPCSGCFSVPTRRVSHLGSSPIPCPERWAPLKRAGGSIPVFLASRSERSGGEGGEKEQEKRKKRKLGTALAHGARSRDSVGSE